MVKIVKNRGQYEPKNSCNPEIKKIYDTDVRKQKWIMIYPVGNLGVWIAKPGHWLRFAFWCSIDDVSAFFRNVKKES